MGKYSENYALRYYVESSNKSDADKLDTLTSRIDVCRQRISVLDERIDAIEKKMSQKFISNDEGTDQIHELDQKRARLADKIAELEDAIIALSDNND